MQREEPYLGLTVGEIWQRCQVRKGPKTGGAWLSSARVVRCWVKSRNERNPRRMLPASKVGDSYETAGVNSEEGGDDVKSSCPLCLGLHACYNGWYKGLRYRKVERIPKASLSSDWGLQLDPMKSESLVIADQQRCGEYVPGPCTHRPSRHESRQHPKPVAQPVREGAVEGGAGDWDEVVTR